MKLFWFVSCFAGRLWPGFVRDIVLNRFVSSPIVPLPLRWRLLRVCGMDVGRCHVSPTVWFGSCNLSIGEGTFINYGVSFNTASRISIGAQCGIGMYVMFVTGTHRIGATTRRMGEFYSEPIEVGDGVWIGAGATILPGVSLGPGSVVAAGSVVAKDVPSDCLVGGVPARVIRLLK